MAEDETRRPRGSISRIPARSEQLAVALQRDAERGHTRMTAKGRGAIAEQILQVAFDRDIKVRTDADLLEILEAVEVDSEIPLEALAAVSEILSYIYRSTTGPEGPSQA